MKTSLIGIARASLSIAGLLTVTSACTAFYPARPADVSPRSTIAVTFDEPRTLEATRDTVVYALPAIRSLYGRLESVRSDTLVLRVIGLESNERQPRLPDAAQVRIMHDATASVSVQRVARGRTWALAGVTVAGLFALFLATLEFPAPAY